MNKLLILMTAIVLLSSCSNSNHSEKDKEILAIKNQVALENIQNKGAELLGKEIQTQGIVDHVCRHGGKKILLVGDGVDIHVFAEERYDESLVGKEISVTGIVKEERTDEATLLQIEEDAINIHNEGEAAEIRQERMISYVNLMRDSLKNSGVDHFSEYYLQYVSSEELNKQ